MTLILDGVTKWEKASKEHFEAKSPALKEEIQNGESKGYAFKEFSQDLYSSLFQAHPSVKAGSPGTQWAKQVMEAMLGTENNPGLPEFKTLKALGTIGGSFESGIGSIALAKHFAQSLPVKETPNPDELEAEIAGLLDFANQNPEHPKAETAKNRAKVLQGQLGEAVEEWGQPLDEQATRIAARKALQAAISEVEETSQVAGAFGCGKGPGQDSYTSAEQKARLANYIRNNDKLRKIAELAGRFQAEAAKVQANKKHPGPDELSDVELGSALGRMLPSEAMALMDPDLEVLFFQKFTESKLMQYYLEAVEKKARGPIVVCIDNSGSMAGPKEFWSKAIALALCNIAVATRRVFQILHFNTGVARADTFDPDSMDPERLIESCAFFAGGGTDFAPVLRQAFAEIKDSAIKDLRQADIIFITDGIAEIPASFQAEIAQAKKDTGASMQTVCLQDGSEELKALSEHYTELHELTDDADTKESLFSI